MNPWINGAAPKVLLDWSGAKCSRSQGWNYCWHPKSSIESGSRHRMRLGMIFCILNNRTSAHIALQPFQTLNTIVAEVELIELRQCVQIFEFSYAIGLQREYFQFTQVSEPFKLCNLVLPKPKLFQVHQGIESFNLLPKASNKIDNTSSCHVPGSYYRRVLGFLV